MIFLQQMCRKIAVHLSLHIILQLEQHYWCSRIKMRFFRSSQSAKSFADENSFHLCLHTPQILVTFHPSLLSEPSYWNLHWICHCYCFLLYFGNICNFESRLFILDIYQKILLWMLKHFVHMYWVTVHLRDTMWHSDNRLYEFISTNQWPVYQRVHININQFSAQ